MHTLRRYRLFIGLFFLQNHMKSDVNSDPTLDRNTMEQLMMSRNVIQIRADSCNIMCVLKCIQVYSGTSIGDSN